MFDYYNNITEAYTAFVQPRKEITPLQKLLSYLSE